MNSLKDVLEEALSCEEAVLDPDDAGNLADVLVPVVSGWINENIVDQLKGIHDTADHSVGTEADYDLKIEVLTKNAVEIKKLAGRIIESLGSPAG